MPENNQLSERELEILKLLATGASNKEIANELVISINTVKVHLRNIYSKLEVSSRTEATIYAVQMGLVPSPTLSQSLEKDDTQDEIEADTPLWRSQPVVTVAFVSLVVILIVIIGFMGDNWWQQQFNQTETPIPAQIFEQDRWEIRARMITPRSNFASAVLDDMIYAIGGETGNELSSTVERYSVERNQWEAVTGMPEARADVQAVTIGGRIFVPGGRIENGDLSDQLLVYEPRNGAWQELSPMPVPLSAYALAAFEGKLYLFGGWDGEQYLDLVYGYDPDVDQWRSLPPMPTARGFAGAAVASGKIFVAGGFDGQTALTAHEVYFPDREGGTASPWEQATPLPAARYAMGVTSIADIIHVVGGLGEENDLESMAYFPPDDRWQIFETPAGGVGAYLGTEPVGSYLYLIGGQLNGVPNMQNLAYQAIYISLLPVFP